MVRDDNGYLQPKIEWIFYPIRVWIWTNLFTFGYINGEKFIPTQLESGLPMVEILGKDPKYGREIFFFKKFS